MRATRVLLATLVGMGVFAWAAPAFGAEPARKFQSDVNTYFTDPAAPALGAFVSAPFTDPTDTIYFTATAITRVQSAAYKGAVGTAAEGKWLYLYQVECTGGNVVWSGGANLLVPLGSAAGHLDTTVFGDKFIQVSSVPGDSAPVSFPSFPGLPLPSFFGNMDIFDLSEFGALGGQFSEGYHDAFESTSGPTAGYVVADGDNTGIFWSAAILGFVTDHAPIVGKAYVNNVSAGSTEFGAVFAGYDVVSAVVPTGSGTSTPPPGDIITPPPATVDDGPPHTDLTHTPTPNAAGWNNTDVLLDFHATDPPDADGDVSGIDHIHVDVSYDANGDGDTTDAGEFTSVEPPGPAGDMKSHTLTDEGIYSIHYGATDLAGNVEPLHDHTVMIDKTDPVITATATTADGMPYTGAWTTQDVIVSYSCTDNLSGVASVSGSETVSGEGDGLSATGTCSDRADNDASTTFGGIRIDRTGPSASCVETTNPSFKNTPTAGPNAGKSGQNPDGYYRLLGEDGLAGVLSIVVFDDGSPFVSMPFMNMDTMKATQTPGGTPNDTRPGPGGTTTSHMKTNGDAWVRVTDLAGNVTSAACRVAPPPK